MWYGSSVTSKVQPDLGCEPNCNAHKLAFRGFQRMLCLMPMTWREQPLFAPDIKRATQLLALKPNITQGSAFLMHGCQELGTGFAGSPHSLGYCAATIPRECMIMSWDRKIELMAEIS